MPSNLVFSFKLFETQTKDTTFLVIAWSIQLLRTTQAPSKNPDLGRFSRVGAISPIWEARHRFSPMTGRDRGMSGPHGDVAEPTRMTDAVEKLGFYGCGLCIA
jgi:hypothetical protein